MEPKEKLLGELNRLIHLLDKEQLELCNVHFKKAALIIEGEINPANRLFKKVEDLKGTIRALDRDIKLERRSDKKYYQKLISIAINNLKEIHEELSKK